MTAQMGLLPFGVLLTLAVLAGLLPVSTRGNVMGQRALQRERLVESAPEVISMNDKDEYRELEEPSVNDYFIKSKNDEQYVENALINYLLAKKMQYNYETRARDEATIGAQKKSYWKQCAFNAVSCFG